jgi:hypothetical protein
MSATLLESRAEPECSLAERTLALVRSVWRARNFVILGEAANLEFPLRTESHRKYGFGSFTDFAREMLQMSTRSVKRRVALRRMVTVSSAVATSIEDGRLSPCQALALRPVLDSADVARWIELAETCTVRELRELVVAQVGGSGTDDDDASWQRVTFAAPYSAAIAWDQGMECARRVLGFAAPTHVCVEARTKSGIEDSVMARLPKLAREAMQEASGDSIWGPWQLRRLEILVEIVALAENEAPIWPLDEPPMLAPRSTTISFWAPEDLVRRWQSAIRAMQEKAGPLPSWAAAIIILRHAVDEWERIDPSRRPAETPIYERDEWRCQAPGCSARRRLEAHHIIFKSAGGTDDPENLITLCHAHHRQGIHEDRVKLTGKAPWNLKWRMGSPGYRWQWSRPGNQSVILAGPS